MQQVKIYMCIYITNIHDMNGEHFIIYIYP